MAPSGSDLCSQRACFPGRVLRSQWSPQTRVAHHTGRHNPLCSIPDYILVSHRIVNFTCSKLTYIFPLSSFFVVVTCFVSLTLNLLPNLSHYLLLISLSVIIYGIFVISLFRDILYKIFSILYLYHVFLFHNIVYRVKVW